MAFARGFLLLALMLALPLGVGGAHAQSLPPAKIAVVDYQRVLKRSNAGQDVHRQIEGYRKELQSQIKGEEEKLRVAEDQLRSQRATIAPDEFQKRRRDFEAKVIDLQRRAQDWMRSLEDTYQEAMNRLHDPLLPLVQEMTKQRGYNIVVDHSQMLMVATGLDLTDEVIEQLNKRIPKIQVTKPKTK